MLKKISVLATLFLILFSFSLLGCMENYEYTLEVEGGLVIEESDSKILIRSYSPDTKIDIQGFRGDLLVTNCHSSSDIKGVGGADIDGTNVSVEIDDEVERTIKIDAPEKEDLRFAVIGDTQGMDHIFMDAVSNMHDYDFLIHLGDITPSGKSEEFNRAQRVMNSTDFPVYTTLGNHDVKSEGREFYSRRFAPTQYSFTHASYNFIFLDSSNLSVKQNQIDWMESRLVDDKENVIITHAPYYDPFGGSHTVDKDSAEVMSDFIAEHDVDAFISGHIHAYYQDEEQGTKRLITGGGGGSLVEGEHHYVSVNGNTLNFTKISIATEEQNIYEITIEKGDKTVTKTYQGLLYSSDAEGNSSFQNQFGNKKGQGYYEGVKISTLLEEVGGMSRNDTLIVKSIDGYEQKFGYLNIYPDEDYMQYQGELVLATEYNNQTIDDWEDGPRLVTIPEDGYYSSEDCANTSYEGQGWNVYESAGARWVKYVKTIRVIEDG